MEWEKEIKKEERYIEKGRGRKIIYFSRKGYEKGK